MRVHNGCQRGKGECYTAIGSSIMHVLCTSYLSQCMPCTLHTQMFCLNVMHYCTAALCHCFILTVRNYHTQSNHLRLQSAVFYSILRDIDVGNKINQISSYHITELQVAA